MSGSRKDRLAALVIDRHCVFQSALAGSRNRYPTRESQSFAAGMRQYEDATREDEMLHRCVVSAVNGLSSICKAKAEGCRTKSYSKPKYRNACSSPAMIHTSMAISLLVSAVASFPCHTAVRTGPCAPAWRVMSGDGQAAERPRRQSGTRNLLPSLSVPPSFAGKRLATIGISGVLDFSPVLALNRRSTTIHYQVATRHVATFIGSEEKRSRGDLRWIAQPPKGDD